MDLKKYERLQRPRNPTPARRASQEPCITPQPSGIWVLGHHLLPVEKAANRSGLEQELHFAGSVEKLRARLNGSRPRIIVTGIRLSAELCEEIAALKPVKILVVTDREEALQHINDPSRSKVTAVSPNNLELLQQQLA